MRVIRVARWARRSWVDIAWVAFIGLNLLLMQLLPSWQTVPFLVIWVTLTTLYGFRLWRLGSALIVVVVVTLATGGLVGWQVARGEQDIDYLAEVPLLAMLFLVVVWHSRRRLAAVTAANQVSAHNLRLLEQQRQFLQDASHELGTPIAIALGHAELIENSASDQAIVQDARVAVEELLRMRRLTSRMLLLAGSESPDFLQLAPVDVEQVMVEALHRWSHVPRRWSVDSLADVSVLADGDRLTVALDALIENAVRHTDEDSQIDLSAIQDGQMVVLAVSDSGIGIAPDDVERIFARFSRIDTGRNRTAGGFGLGLAVVKAIAEAHNGSVQVRSTVGEGSVFEICLPVLSPVGRPSLPASLRAS